MAKNKVSKPSTKTTTLKSTEPQLVGVGVIQEHLQASGVPKPLAYGIATTLTPEERTGGEAEVCKRTQAKAEGLLTRLAVKPSHLVAVLGDNYLMAAGEHTTASMDIRLALSALHQAGQELRTLSMLNFDQVDPADLHATLFRLGQRLDVASQILSKVEVAA